MKTLMKRLSHPSRWVLFIFCLVVSLSLVIIALSQLRTRAQVQSGQIDQGSGSPERRRNDDQPKPAGAISTCDTTGPIEVESTGGTLVPTAYLTLKGAFDAIIAGTHTGSINIEVCGNTTETATAALTASGLGATSYTDVTIRPVGGARIIEGTLSGAGTGAVVKLTGADNVTIDGRIGGVGTNRDLTVRNNSVATATAAIWLTSTGVGAGATGNTVRNLEIACGAGQDTLTVSTFGIIMASNNTAISVSSGGDDNDNNSFIANRIIKARYGIVTRGQTTNNNQNITVTDNIIGPAAFGVDQIGRVGIFMQADTGATVSRNTVQFVGCLEPQACTGADRMGIAIGNEFWSSSPGTITSNSYTVTKNIVHDVIDELTFSAVGINLATTGGGSATNNLVANNFIYNVRANGTLGDAGVGIGIAGGANDRVVFNSISMTGDIDPVGSTTATQNTVGIRVANANGTTHFGLTLMDNSIYVDVTSNTGTLLHYDIAVNSATYAWTGGGLNYNNYYFPVSNPQMRTGGLGTSSLATTSFQTLANWQTAFTPTPQDANSIQADPLYVSTTSDLHIGPSSPNESMGTAITGVTDDIDGDVRPVTPDIGADEVTLVGPTPTPTPTPTPVIVADGSILATESCPPANGQIDPGERATVHLKLKNNGGAATSNLVATLQSSGGVVAPSGPQNYGVISPGATVGRDFTFTADPAVGPGGTITATLQLQDGATNLGTVTYTFTAGPSPCGGVRLVTSSTLVRTSPSNVQATITVTNTGTLPATNVMLTTATLGGTPGTPLPQSLGTINPGASVSTTVNFATSSTGPSTLKLEGTFTGGTFSSTKRVTIPGSAP